MLPTGDSQDSDRWHAFDAYRPQLVAACLRRGLGRDDAEDIASEAIIRAANDPAVDHTACGAWLHVVALRLAVDLVRRRPSVRVLGRVAALSVPESAHDRVLDRMEARWVADVVARLPHRQRRVLELRASGLRSEDIARELDCSYKTVESLTSRGRATVRQAMARALVGLGVLGTAARRLGAGSPAVAAAAAAVCFAVAIGFAPRVEQRQPIAPTTATAAPAPHTAVALPARQVATAPRGRATAHAVLRRPSQSAESVVLPAGGAGPVSHGRVVVVRSHEDETVLDTTLRCLEEGPQLTTVYLGCA